MKKINLLILAVFFSAIVPFSAAAQVSSVYTNLTKDNCQTVETTEETGGSVQKCKGFGAWSLMVLDDDERMSVNVVAPDEKQHELDFWSVITPAFSSLGTKAEWRVKKEGDELQPIALIIRVNSTSEATGKRKRSSYLAVSKITADGICVVEKISGQKNANQLAQTSADNSAQKPCLQKQ